MAKPQKPHDVIMANGWYLTIPVDGIQSDGLFETLDGINKSSGVTEVVDAGTNKKYKFTDQLTDYGEMTLTRPYNGSATDKAMEALATTMIETGLKLPVTATKLHHGEPVFTIAFEGFHISAVSHPTLDVASQEKYMVSYTAHCDGWTII